MGIGGSGSVIAHESQFSAHSHSRTRPRPPSTDPGAERRRTGDDMETLERSYEHMFAYAPDGTRGHPSSSPPGRPRTSALNTGPAAAPAPRRWHGLLRSE